MSDESEEEKQPEGSTAKDLCFEVGRRLMSDYWKALYDGVKANPTLLKTFPGFLLKPDRLIFYMGRTHIGIEYVGEDRLAELPAASSSGIMQVFDYSLDADSNLVSEIVGFDDPDGRLYLPLVPMTEDLVLPTRRGAEELERLKWNWSAQDMIAGFGMKGVQARPGQFTRLINARFFDANERDGLRTRHIKWLDLIPCQYDDSGSELDEFVIDFNIYRKLKKTDLHATYPLPPEWKFDRVQKLNRFVEFVGDKTKNETDITRLLATDEYSFILKMRFSAQEVAPECTCEWQSIERPAIKPDFFVVASDGYAEIVEFKLPELGRAVVGTRNRETFSAAINSYISQTRVYQEYFDDPNNREYVKRTHGFDTYKPRRHLVMGRRWDLPASDWRKIAADFPSLTIHTYDDLIDGVVMQFYS